MVRITIDVALAVAVVVFGLEAIHYRNAVLTANVDLKRAWVDLREKCEHAPTASKQR